MVNKFCRVCGLDQEESQWDPPTFAICSCCGIQFGVGDVGPTHDQTLEGVRFYRNYWIENGASWFSPEEKPDNRSLEEQMKNIPKEWL